MGGKMSRDKGARLEREFAKLIGGKKVPLSGASRELEWKDDVIDSEGRHWECKGRRDGFKFLYQNMPKALSKGGLALRANNKKWLVVMYLDDYCEEKGWPPKNPEENESEEKSESKE
jgi:hypothetical protein